MSRWTEGKLRSSGPASLAQDWRSPMKFGLVYEIAVPYPSDPELDRRTFENCLAQVKLADALGFDQVWAVEHHFLRHQSYSSAPEIFLTACAMATERIRLGHGIVICVPEVNHPVRIAERAAFLDHLSAGRVELGTGRAATWMELSGFGASVDDTKKSWDEFVRAIPRMWTQERYAHQGRVLLHAGARGAAIPLPGSASAPVGRRDQPRHGT